MEVHQFRSDVLTKDLDSLLSSGWTIASTLFAQDGLSSSAIVVVDRELALPTIFRGIALPFGTTHFPVLEQCHPESLKGALFISKAVIGFRSLDAAPQNVPDHHAIIVVCATPAGLGRAQACRVYPQPQPFFFGEISDLPLPPTLPPAIAELLCRSEASRMHVH